MTKEEELSELILKIGGRGLSRKELGAKIEHLLETFGESRYSQGYTDGVVSGNRRKPTR